MNNTLKRTVKIFYIVVFFLLCILPFVGMFFKSEDTSNTETDEYSEDDSDQSSDEEDYE